MRLFLAGLAVLLAGCAHTFHPVEYPLSANRIGDFPTSGPVTTSNAMHDTGLIAIVEDSNRWSAALEDVSQAVSSQLQEEINRHGRPGAGPGKTLSISVFRFNANPSSYVVNTDVGVRVLGDGGFQKIVYIRDTTNGNFPKSFNATIAISVVRILSDPDVLAYMKRP